MNEGSRLECGYMGWVGWGQTGWDWAGVDYV